MNSSPDGPGHREGSEIGADAGIDVVTGAFSYSGSSIARALIDAGRHVRTITGHLDRAPQDTPIEVRPLNLMILLKWPNPSRVRPPSTTHTGFVSHTVKLITTGLLPTLRHSSTQRGERVCNASSCRCNLTGAASLAGWWQDKSITKVE